MPRPISTVSVFLAIIIVHIQYSEKQKCYFLAINVMWRYRYRLYCTNQHLQVPITTGTVTDSSSEYTGFISVICGYIYRNGEL